MYRYSKLYDWNIFYIIGFILEIFDLIFFLILKILLLYWIFDFFYCNLFIYFYFNIFLFLYYLIFF